MDQKEPTLPENPPVHPPVDEPPVEHKPEHPMAVPAPVHPASSVPPASPAESEKHHKLKFYFLYVLVGGLVLSALISVGAILIGEFNQSVQRALFTTLVLMVHSLLALAVIGADKNNQLGRQLLPTVILTTVVANMFTSVFGIWNIWGSEWTAKAFGIYALVIGMAFIVQAIGTARLPHKVVNGLYLLTLTLIGVLTAMLAIWILVGSEGLDPLFYRGLGAISILAATALIVLAIIRRITVSKQPELASMKPHHPATPGGMVAIYVVVGVITAMIWFVGFAALMVSGTYSGFEGSTRSPYYDSSDSDYYNRPL